MVRSCPRAGSPPSAERTLVQLATWETLFPTFGDTRTAAGGGLTGDTLKCQLKPLDFASYPVTFTAAQQTPLQATFPTGVCDFSKPGVDERPPLGTCARLRPAEMLWEAGLPARLPPDSRRADERWSAAGICSRGTRHGVWFDVYAGTIASFPFTPGVHVNYESTVLPMKDGLPKLKDFPVELGGSGEAIPE